MKRCISIVLSLVCLLSVFTVTGCGKAEEKEIQELHEQFYEDVRRMDLTMRLTDPNVRCTGVYTREKVADFMYFLPQLYELYCHAYTLDSHDYGGGKSMREYASAEEVKGLFLEFDKEVYERFETVKDWFLLFGGRWYVDSYNSATVVARDLYNGKYGENILPGDWSEWSLEERIELENFIRDNPDFMPIEEYENELKYLGIIEFETN